MTTPTSGAADLPEALRIANVLDLAKQIDYYNHVQDDLDAAAAELRRLHALTTQQQRDLIAESHRTAEQKLRADQMTTQHAHQAALNTEARAQLAAALTAQAISAEPAAHVQNPAENEHVADDMSKNETGSNMTQQPAPATQQAGWTSADADAARLALELECLLMDTKDTAIVSKWWQSANDALELHRARLQEVRASPTAHAAESVPAVADAMADSQYLAGVSAGWNAANADDPNAALQKLHESRAGYLKPLSAARAPAESVLEDAARLTTEQEYAIRQGHEIAASEAYFGARSKLDTNRNHNIFTAGFERGWDAARKQGDSHDL